MDPSPPITVIKSMPSVEGKSFLGVYVTKETLFSDRILLTCARALWVFSWSYATTNNFLYLNIGRLF